jgi:hypothetical protein
MYVANAWRIEIGRWHKIFPGKRYNRNNFKVEGTQCRKDGIAIDLDPRRKQCSTRLSSLSGARTHARQGRLSRRSRPPIPVGCLVLPSSAPSPDSPKGPLWRWDHKFAFDAHRPNHNHSSWLAQPSPSIASAEGRKFCRTSNTRFVKPKRKKKQDLKRQTKVAIRIIYLPSRRYRPSKSFALGNALTTAGQQVLTMKKKSRIPT